MRGGRSFLCFHSIGLISCERLHPPIETTLIAYKTAKFALYNEENLIPAVLVMCSAGHPGRRDEA